MMTASPLQLTGKLAQLTTEVNHLHDETVATIRTAIRQAQQMGAKLEEIDNELKHGEWKRWLEDHFHGKPASAYVYKRLNRNWKKIEKQVNSGRIKTIDAALKFLRTTKATPDTLGKIEKDPLFTKKKEWKGHFDHWLEDLTQDDVNRGEELDDSGTMRLLVGLNTIKTRKDEASDTLLFRQRPRREPAGASAGPVQPQRDAVVLRHSLPLHRNEPVAAARTPLPC